MRIVRESIVRKLFLKLVFIALILGAIYYYFFWKEQKEMTVDSLIILLSLFTLIFAIFYYLDFVQPLKKILIQFNSLLLGKAYKRIFTTRIDEIGILAYFFNQVTKGFSEVSGSIEDRERMLDELSSASQLQKEILPISRPNFPDLDIVAKNKPATELGGDSFNYFQSKNKTYIYIGDVTGHGVAAGLLMTMAYSLISVFSDSFNSAYEILVNVNKYLKKHIKKAMYMTMVMLSYDHTTKKMTYTGAGHEHIIVYKPGMSTCETILSGGVALGMVPDNSRIIKEKELDVSDGDIVVLYSDGIIEARNNDEEMYGLSRLKDSISANAPQFDIEGLNYHIAKEVTDFMGGHIQDDDMTLIVVKIDSKRVVKNENK